MNDIQLFVQELGGLHDARMNKLAWLATERRLEIEINDIYANFFGLPDYKGPKKATFIFSEVSRFEILSDWGANKTSIFDWVVVKNDLLNYTCEISMSPHGLLLIDCASIELRDDPINKNSSEGGVL